MVVQLVFYVQTKFFMHYQVIHTRSLLELLKLLILKYYKIMSLNTSLQ